MPPSRPPAMTGPGPATLAMLRTLAATFLLLCAVEVVRLTVVDSPASVGIAHTNLHPGASIRQYLRNASLHTQLLQLGGNILIGVPLGFALPQLTPRMRGVLRVALAAAVFFTGVELAQHLLATGRAFDVDDILLATGGAILGYFPLGRMFGKRLHPDYRHPWQRRIDEARRRRKREKPGS